MKKLTMVSLILVFLFCKSGCGSGNNKGGDGTNTGDAIDGIDFIQEQPIYDQRPDVQNPEYPDIFYEPELCGMDEFNVTRVIPDILILLDRSNSMSFTPPTPPLWNTIRQAIITVTSAMDNSIWFGLMSFPNSVPPNECNSVMQTNQCTAPAPTSVLVPVGPDQSDMISNVLMSLTTCGGTPTAMSLQSANDYLSTVNDNHPKYIILATDGAPNCNPSLSYPCRCTGDNCDLNNLNCLDDTRTYAVLQNLCANGVKTYILGMGGATSWTDVLQGMANAGCTNTYYAAESPDEIQNALDEITQGALTCEFEMDCADIPDTNKVNFYFDGVVVPRNTSHTTGWDWTDTCDSTSDPSGKIQFYGDSCDKIMNQEVEKVSATFGCPTQVY